jgi:hypothetical integral membrane protein (TIGR02206 family)
VSVPAVQAGWIGTPFAAFGPTHAFIAAMALGACLACGVLARREAGRGRRSFADGFAGVVLGWNLLANLWWLLPANFKLDTSLPLHVCDLVNLVIPFAIWSRNRFLLALSVLWGLGLSTQAFFTPTVDEAPGDMRYWLFWGGHLTAAAGCCVIAGGIDFRPGWKDWGRVLLAGVGVVLALMWFNHLTGSNYGYVGNATPSQPTLIDRLGPWPTRVVWLIVLGSAAQAIVVVLYPLLSVVIGVLARRVGRR